MGIVTCHRKPINVQAWQVPDYDVIEWDKIADWCNGSVVPGREHPYKTPAFLLVGKGARVPAFVGDWIIKNSVNDIYPVPKLLFEQTYEILQDPTVFKYSGSLREDLDYLGPSSNG
jgi:hypothetical protein